MTYENLPPPPSPDDEKNVERIELCKSGTTKTQLKRIRKELRTEWELLLNEHQQKTWRKMTQSERGVYLFEDTEIGRLTRPLRIIQKTNLTEERKKNEVKKPKSLTAEEKNQVEFIKKQIVSGKKDEWDYTKTDWDVT